MNRKDCTNRRTDTTERAHLDHEDAKNECVRQNKEHKQTQTTDKQQATVPDRVSDDARWLATEESRREVVHGVGQRRRRSVVVLSYSTSTTSTKKGLSKQEKRTKKQFSSEVSQSVRSVCFDTRNDEESIRSANDRSELGQVLWGGALRCEQAVR